MLIIRYLYLNRVKLRKKEQKSHVYLGDISLGELKNSLTVVFKTNGDNNKLTLTRLIFEKK